MLYRTHAFSAAGFTAIAAHRGGAAMWPECSAESLAGSIACGVDAVECDVHLSKDNAVMVIHDALLERTVCAKGAVRDFSAAQLQKMKLRGALAGVPLLSTWIKTLQAEKVSLSLELKADVNDAAYAGLEEKCVQLLEEFAAVEASMVHSFDFSVLRKLRALNADLFLGANVEAENETHAGSFAALLDAVLALGAGCLNADYRMMTVEKMRAAQTAGLSVTLWTVNAEADLRFWLQAGADAIATDVPALAMALRAKLQG